MFCGYIECTKKQSQYKLIKRKTAKNVVKKFSI